MDSLTLVENESFQMQSPTATTATVSPAKTTPPHKFYTSQTPLSMPKQFGRT